MHVTFDNNSNHYSNLVAIRQTASNYKPNLVNSLVVNGVISVTSPAVFDYAIFEMNGKMLKKGKLSPGMNTIPAGSIINGMYLINFSDGNAEWTEKLVKQ